MKYDFTSIIERAGKDALAVDMPAAARESGEGYFSVPIRNGFDAIPMWVADMNFATAPSIPAAIKARLSHPVYGYFSPREEYFDAIIKWQTERNGAEGLTAECIGYENGVLGGVVSAAGILCSRGDKILVHAPTYVGFTGALGNAGYELVHSPLVLDENNVWRMDFEDMERKIKEQHIHAAIFCSPHNPTGRAWERWEIERAMELFQKYDVYVISDEIWSDLYLADYRHIPTQSVSEDAKARTIAFYAPSKTFNLAGLIGSYHIVYNERLRDRLRKEASLCHYNTMNLLSMYALMGAYTPAGEEWLAELKEVLTKNIEYAYEYITTRWKGVKVSKPQATYMLFLDCEEWCKAHGKTMDELQQAGISVGVLWQDGRAFHGKYAIRMNLALPFSRVQEALERLDRYVFETGTK
ncbi:MAG: aminotransferase class I/II-fold pyridoxal phosphate-dependent enzyme [Lachnospiraceae bacterium]|nr:aminotransferase class I/II-fold pyridoxal phosphate-dependent enzyme [Lachnospiraceae bacterium]